jgi:hypothetical protein
MIKALKKLGIRAGDMPKVVECLPSMYEVFENKHKYCLKKTKKERKRKDERKKKKKGWKEKEKERKEGRKKQKKECNEADIT